MIELKMIERKMIEHRTTIAPAESVQTRIRPTSRQNKPGVWPVIQLAVIVSYAFTYFTPLLSVFAGFLATYMIISLTQRGFLWQPAVAAGLAIVLGAAVGSAELPLGASLVFLLWALLPALVFGTTWNLSRSAGKATLALALTIITLVTVLFSLAGDTVYQILDFQESWLRDSAPSVYTRLSVGFSALRWLFPAFIGLSAATPAFCAWMIVVIQNEPEIHRSFFNWRLSRSILWLALLALAGKFAAQLAGQDLIIQACDNLLVVLLISFSVTGLLVVEYLFRRFRLHIAWRVITYTVAVVTLHFGGLALALAGMLDTLIDFRAKLETS